MTTSHSIKLLRCQLGSEVYGFEMSSVVGVYHASAMRRSITATTGEPVGWVSVPGELEVPVYRLADCLNRSILDTDERQHVVVAQSSLGPQGFLIGSATRVLSIPAEQFQVCPELLNDPERRLFKSLVQLHQASNEDAMIFVLSPERLHRRARPLTTTSLGERRSVSPSTVATSPEPARCPGPNGARLAGHSGIRTERIVLFPLANTRVDGHELLCGLSVAQVAEILEPLPIIPIAFAPPHVAGFVTWRGQAVPVLHLSLILGVADALATSRMMIVRQGSKFLALLTSQVLRARRLPLPHQPCPTPIGLDSDAILGTFQSESELLVVPNLSRLTRPQSLGA